MLDVKYIGLNSPAPISPGVLSDLSMGPLSRTMLEAGFALLEF